MTVEMPPGARPLMLEDPSAMGRYRLLGRLGIGGMGVVYLGFDASSGRMVAIKTLHPAFADDSVSRLRFSAERDFGRRVSTFCIPRVLDDGIDGSRPYLVTEYVEGMSLADRVESQGPLTGDTLEAVAIAVAAALVAIHTAGLAHRDLKPANVLLSPDGPQVIDFGIASDLEVAGGLTQTGIVMGSPGWIAPERLVGRPGSAASDVFGWGCLVAFAATGHSPFGSGPVAERTELVLSGSPTLTGLHEPWRGLVALALDQDPEARPSADDLLRTLLAERGRPAGLQQAAETIAELWTVPEPAGNADLPPPQPLPRRRNVVMPWVITAAAVTIALASIVGSAATPDSAAEPGNGSVPAAGSTSTTPAARIRTPAATTHPAPSAADRRVRTSTGPVVRPNPPALPGKVKKLKKWKEKAGYGNAGGDHQGQD